MTARALIAALLAALSLRLLPPGWSERRHERVRPPMPAALAGGSRAQSATEQYRFHAAVAPAPARLGQQLVYRAHAYADPGVRVDFAPPEAGGDFTWGAIRTGKASVSAGPGMHSWMRDSVWMEVPLQVFRIGPVSIPGPAVRISPSDPGRAAFVTRLPTLRVFVLPTVTATDTAATLRPLHGPLGAPWWERVPWRIVLAVAFALMVVAAWWRWVVARRRRPVVAPAPVAVARPAVDATAEALAALARLRAQRLPEAGRFADHAFGLTRILRRYLERTLGTPRPGDTSPELLVRLRASRLSAEDVRRLEGLLGLWDRVKFARAPLDAGEADRCEIAVESLVRRRESPREVA